MAELEKIKIKIIPNDIVHIKHNEQDISINPWISLVNKTILYRNYIESYYKVGDIVGNYIDAEYSLILGIVDLCTNISLDDVNVDALISSGLWEEIKSQIKNYSKVVADLYNILKFIADKNVMEKSMSVTFDKLVESILQFIYNVDLSSEGIQNLVGELKKQATEFEVKFMPDDEQNKEEETLKYTL